MLSLSYVFLLSLCAFIIPGPGGSEDLRACTKADYKYVYTECQNNARWRVQVPSGNCTAGTVEFPMPGKKCNVNCPSGQYLDINNNDCAQCPAGTYSLGSGVRFDMWTSGLPEGFTTSADQFGTGGSGSCSRAKWKPMGSYLAGQSDSNCQLSLTYTVNLVNNGDVTFYYQYRSESEIFAFEVQNGLCESVGRDDSASPVLDETDRNEIKRHTVPLKMGMNVLRWQIVPLSDGIKSSSASSTSPSSSTSSTRIIALHSIQVSGIPYVYTCQSCHPGYFSLAGASKCSKCQTDTYSPDGRLCRPCQPGQYSIPGSADCKRRPACLESDYALVYSDRPCTVADNYKVNQPRYDWIQPKICAGGVSLPTVLPAAAKIGFSKNGCSGAYCNAGMQTGEAKDPLSCQACPDGHYSDGTSGVCQICPAKTQVVHEYVASNWLTVPPLMNLSCLVLQDDGVVACAQQAWNLMGDRLQTAPTRLRHSSVLTLDFSGFYPLPASTEGASTSSADDDDAAAAAAASDKTVGSLIIDFEVACDTPCRLFLLKYENKHHVEIKTWSGKQPRTQFKYIIRRTDRHKFFLIFEPAPFVEEEDEQSQQTTAGGSASTDWSRNRLTVHSIRAANAKGSGGVRCQACPLGILENKCIPCPAGKYYDAKNVTCYSCPAGRVVAKLPAEGVDSCLPCPAGMRAVDGQACVLSTDGPKNPDRIGLGPEFDFSDLLSPNRYWLAEGVKQFTGRGSKYMHVYNVSLNAASKARCVSNATTVTDSTIESFVCRATIIPNNRNTSLTLAALPTSFADRILNASSSKQSPGAEAMLADAGWAADPYGTDTHVFFESDYTTKVCKRRVTLITLRCDPKSKLPKLSLPPKCPDGTCDGCNFHLLLEARQACRLCRDENYERLNGECVMGKQTVHLLPPKRCYLPSGDPIKKTQVVDCPLVNKPVGIVMIVILFIGFVSLAVACHCYRKNKTLQYKYMQLVESKEGELPGVESCAVHEGEGEDGEEIENYNDDEEDIEVSVRRGRRSGGGGSGSAMLSKLKRSILPSGSGSGGRRSVGGGRGGGSNVEHLNLTEQMDDLSL